MTPSCERAGTGDPDSHHGPLRILLLAPFPPRQDGVHGGARAIAGLVHALANRHHVALIYLRADDETPADAGLNRTCQLVVEVRRDEARHGTTGRYVQKVRNLTGLVGGRPVWVSKWSATGLTSEARRIIREWDPDIIQLEFEVMARFLDEIGRTRAPIVLTVHDPGHASARETAAARRTSVFERLDARAWRRFARHTLDRVDAAVAFTDRDVGELRGLRSGTGITCIPLGQPIPERPASAMGDGSQTILFVGNFVHPPNRDAARWLVRSILPRVRARLPTARLVLVGAGPPPVTHSSEGVTVTGRVPDVWPYMDAAAVVAVPIRTGGGMRVKLLEALAAGKAIVATPRAVEGLAVAHDQEILLAGSAEDFADALFRLLVDPDARAVLARAARSWAEEHLSWERTSLSYEHLYRRLLAEGNPPGATP